MPAPTEPDEVDLELGSGVRAVIASWGRHPAAGIILWHDRPDPQQRRCCGSAMFDLPGVREAFPDKALWQVESFNPLTISPSLLCSCGHHGFIRGGLWVPA